MKVLKKKKKERDGRYNPAGEQYGEGMEIERGGKRKLMVQKKFRNKAPEKKRLSGIQNVSGLQQGQFTHTCRKEGEVAIQTEVYWQICGG